MNLDSLKIQDSSGKLSKESYLFKFYPEEYNFIIDFSSKNNFTDIPFKEKVYLSINRIESIPICKNVNCDKNTKFVNSTIGYRDYCSNKCVGSDPNIISLKESNSLLKYGTKSPTQSKEIIDKIIKTNNLRYGGNSPTSSDLIKKKVKDTVRTKYNVDNISSVPEFLEKRIESFKRSSYRENYKKSSLDKYGVDHPWKISDIHNKSIIGSKRSKDVLILENISSKLSSLSQYKLVDIDYDVFKRNIKIECLSCSSIFSINREDFHIRYKDQSVICTLCNPKGSKSGQESELVDFIKSIYHGDIWINTRSVISPYEIDVYLPDIRLGFEYNGLYWHSENEKGKNYHKDKTDRCKNLDIDLIHVWSDDWIYKKSIIKSIISSRIGLFIETIYARKCTISNIKYSESVRFLNDNHILGSSSSKIRIGLITEGRMVALMCFTQKNNGYILSRFCSLLGTKIIGGASKLFRYFIDTYSPDFVLSYSDESMYSGEMYKKLGFRFDGLSEVNYKWVIDGKREHKSNFRKSKLLKLGFDVTKTETDIMYDDVGSYRVWDSGLKRWLYTK